MHAHFLSYAFGFGCGLLVGAGIVGGLWFLHAVGADGPRDYGQGSSDVDSVLRSGL